MTLDDMPQKARPFKQRRVELHGFKFEGRRAKNATVHDNFIRITQHLANDKWDYVPATPLNVACYDPNAMNEVYNNTIVAITKYAKTRHGGYGASGQWASAVFFVGMTGGPAEKGKHSIYIHGNRFISNHLFISASREPNMTIRVERNAFELMDDPVAAKAVYRKIPAAMRKAIEAGGNTFEGMRP